MASGYMEWKGRGREEIEGLDNEQRGETSNNDTTLFELCE